MRKLLAIALLALVFLPMKAGDYKYLVMQTTSGELTFLSTEQLTMTIEDGQLTAKSTAAGQAFTLSDLDRMYFSTTANSISNATIPHNAEGEIFTATGARIGKYKNLTTACKTLKKGIYIVKTKSSTHKIIVK